MEASRPGGARRQAHEVCVAFAGERRGLALSTTRRIVNCVLLGEGSAPSTVTVTFMSAARMRGLNKRTFGRDHATDVIAFDMHHDSRLIADIYICPGVARRSARNYDTEYREELVRLVVHGLLHILGYDHPSGRERTASRMWSQQERYVRRVMTRQC